MEPSDKTPIIVGVGDVKNASRNIDDAHDPSELMVRAIRIAMEDMGLDASSPSSPSSSSFDQLARQVDSLSVVPPWTWPYPDLPGLLADRIGAKPSHTQMGYHGGNQPALQCDEAARRISRGEASLAIITGGESLASAVALTKAGKMPPPHWPKPDAKARKISVSDVSVMGQNAGSRHAAGIPTQVYALYENGWRSRRGQSLPDNNQESAALYASFDQVAVQNPFSWNYGREPKTAKEIGTPSPSNRLIDMPYPLLMNAFNNVNLAAACILTSVGKAKSLGIPREKWVYPLGGAGADDSDYFWERANFYSSPAMSASIKTGMKESLITPNDIDCYDFYSCFPIVPKLACHYLDLSVTDPAKPITLLGGLTSFGGAGNNYSMHAITAMTRELRAKKFTTGLVLANGGTMTHQHVLCLSSNPRKNGAQYPLGSSAAPRLAHEPTAPPFEEYAEGEGVIESYTVDFDRKGSPKLGHVIGLLGNGKRFIANHGNEWTLLQLASSKVEPIGRKGVVVKGDKGRNLFSMNREGQL